MSKIRRKEDRHRLVSMLEEYRREKCLGPRNCKGCTFSIDNNSGCALNLVIHCIEHGLSSYKKEADTQWHELLYGKQACLDQMVAYAELRKKSKNGSIPDMKPPAPMSEDDRVANNLYDEQPNLKRDVLNVKRRYLEWKRNKNQNS